MPRVAVDAMGGDHAPDVVVEGALLAARDLGVEVVLVGQQEPVEQVLARHGAGGQLAIVPAAEVIAMHESPAAALRKKNSSMKVGFGLMKRGEVDAVVSAGNSGAMMATGMFVMGKLPHVARPAILIVVPSRKGGTVVVDAGANVDCKPRHLVQFGLMGSIYAERILGVANPRVGVLSNGEEETKGNDLTRAASEQLAATPLNYIGYVEGRDICKGTVDVVVCDGFTGNVVLKTMEGIARFAGDVLKTAFQRNLVTRVGYLLSRQSLHEAYRQLDYAEYGGAPLIGLEGVAIVAHGGSNPRAIKNAIRAASEELQQDVNRHISEVLRETAYKEEMPQGFWQRLKSKIEHIAEKPEDGETPEQQKRGGEE